ncbi:MAG TPA: dihydrodipicolinate synthase family protein [Pyrinomonadaceae bacterium]
MNHNLQGVFAVPPLARRSDQRRSLDFEQNDLIVKHILSGGITRLIYGGNAFLYHVTLNEFDEMLEWLSGQHKDAWLIPSIGPSFGRAMDQAPLIRKHDFSTAMLLPCADPRDAKGLERGYREIAEAANCKLIIYIKDEENFGSDKTAGLDAVARLVEDGTCIGIKYAVVRDDPKEDLFLDALLARVDRKYVISGIGERPAIIHLRDWQLSGFTTGSGCIAPHLSQKLFEALSRKDYSSAEELREKFIPLEDLRDAWGPARVLHHATALAGIAPTGPVPPYVSELTADKIQGLEKAAGDLASS